MRGAICPRHHRASTFGNACKMKHGGSASYRPNLTTHHHEMGSLAPPALIGAMTGLRIGYRTGDKMVMVVWNVRQNMRGGQSLESFNRAGDLYYPPSWAYLAVRLSWERTGIYHRAHGCPAKFAKFRRRREHIPDWQHPGRQYCL